MSVAITSTSIKRHSETMTAAFELGRSLFISTAGADYYTDGESLSWAVGPSILSWIPNMVSSKCMNDFPTCNGSVLNNTAEKVDPMVSLTECGSHNYNTSDTLSGSLTGPGTLHLLTERFIQYAEQVRVKNYTTKDYLCFVGASETEEERT
jgi:hypothetical protein